MSDRKYVKVIINLPIRFTSCSQSVTWMTNLSLPTHKHQPDELIQICYIENSQSTCHRYQNGFTTLSTNSAATNIAELLLQEGMISDRAEIVYVGIVLSIIVCLRDWDDSRLLLLCRLTHQLAIFSSWKKGRRKLHLWVCLTCD